MTPVGPGATANPFSTCHFDPGTLPFDHDGHGDVPALVDAWHARGRRGEVVGPHGSGKTTLLLEVRACLESRGEPVTFVTLHDGDRHLPRRAFRAIGPRRTLIVDGAEKLSRADRAWVRVATRTGLGLWFSTHDNLGYPVLRRTSVRPELARRLVARVLDRSPHLPRLVEPEDVDHALVQAAGNTREAFLLLYDLYERRLGETRAANARTVPPVR